MRGTASHTKFSYVFLDDQRTSNESLPYRRQLGGNISYSKRLSEQRIGKSSATTTNILGRGNCCHCACCCMPGPLSISLNPSKGHTCTTLERAPELFFFFLFCTCKLTALMRFTTLCICYNGFSLWLLEYFFIYWCVDFFFYFNFQV